MTTDKNINTILIPDIHGRTFWEDALPFIKSGVPTIFLGDYLDVYSHEEISPEFALKQFNKIVELAKTYSNVQLLLGNHDAGYAMDRYICNCRTDIKNYQTIRSIFLDNFELFKLCKLIKIDEKRFMISHAGIHPYWLETYKHLMDEVCKKFNIHHEHLEDMLNDILMTPFSKDFNKNESDDGVFWFKAALECLSACSSERGGRDRAGSLIWADIHEYAKIYTGGKRFSMDQVVGHTMQYYLRKPFILDEIICIDCFECFYLDNEGDLRKLNDDTIVQ